MEAPMATQMFAPVMEEMPIETLKEEMVAMVQEEMPFMAMMEELAPPPPPKVRRGWSSCLARSYVARSRPSARAVLSAAQASAQTERENERAEHARPTGRLLASAQRAEAPARVQGGVWPAVDDAISPGKFWAPPGKFRAPQTP